MGEPLVITVFLLTAVTMRFPFTCKQPLWAVQLVDVYRNSELFTKIRDRSELQGKCGICPFNVMCGGSRSRAYAMTGDMTAADPTCRFQPPQRLIEAS